MTLNKGNVVIKKREDESELSSDRDNDIFNCEEDLFKKGIILINKDITSEACSEWIGKIILLQLESREKITLLINSSGGETYAVLGLINVLQELQENGVDVYTVCIGSALSAAADLLICGGNKRYALPDSTIMVHQAYYTFENKTHNDLINIEVKECKRQHELFVQLYMKKTQLTKKEIENMHKKDTYMSPEMALEKNLIDKIGLRISDWIV
jgi:ATP-dependent Clp protease, protease subunit